MAEPMMEEDTELSEDEAAERARVLDSLGLSLGQSRRQAIQGREACGIEKEWLEDEEFYEGIDDANRGEMAIWRTKPFGQAELPATKATGSTAFFNITRPYCDAAAARVGDMLLPTDDRGWAIKPTPIPEMADIAQGDVPKHLEQQIIKGHQAQRDEMAAQGQEMSDEKFDALVAKSRQDLVDEAAEAVEQAKAAADKAQRRIEDWHVECQYAAEMRHVIEDCSQVGTGVLKGPIPVNRKAVAWKKNRMVIDEKIAPVSKRISVWNCYPDYPACGENIHNGSFHWERDTITKKQLRDLKNQPKYLADQIDACLREGATKAVREVETNEERHMMGLISRDQSEVYEIWYGYVTLEREDLEACGCSDLPDEDIAIPAAVTMVNNHVIKAALNHLDTGCFPYDYMVWSKRANMPWGKGVSRQIRTPQRMVNGAGRNMMDNAGIAGGPMLVMSRGMVEPADNDWTVGPLKIWWVSEDADFDDVAKAFTFIEIPMLQDKLEAIIMLGLKMAEDVTGMPMLLQGQMGTAPDTVGGMKILNDNAGSPMRRIARLFDDRITEPHVRRYYTYLLQHGPEDDEKGDFQIDARGSSALVERDLNNQAIREMGEIVSDPTFGLDKKKWAREVLLSQRLDPKRFEFDDPDWQQLLEALQAQAEQKGGSTEAAQIQAEVRYAIAQLQSQDKDKDRELEKALAGVKEQHDQRLLVMQEAVEALHANVDLEKVQSSERQQAADIKAGLAKLVLELKEQRRLASMDAKTTQIAEPPTEPPGRADDGQAYQE